MPSRNLKRANKQIELVVKPDLSPPHIRGPRNDWLMSASSLATVVPDGPLLMLLG